MIECPSCEKEFENMHGLAVHYGMVHPNKSSPFLPERSVECPYCNKKFKDTFGRHIHCGVVHPNKPKPKYNSEDHPLYGHSHSRKTREKISKSLKGKMSKISKSLKGKMSKIMEERWQDPDCTYNSEEYREKLSKAAKNRFKDPKERKKISEATKKAMQRPEVRKRYEEGMERRDISGENNGNYNRNFSKEHRRKLSEAMKKRWQDPNDPLNSKEYRRKRSRLFSGKNNPMYGESPGYPELYEVDGLNHKVRSSWEEDIALRLVEAGIDYEYEKEFQLENGRHFYPDFTIDHIVVEPHKFIYLETDKEKFGKFHKKFPEYTFIVLSVINASDVCDIWIPWSERNSLIKIIKNERR